MEISLEKIRQELEELNKRLQDPTAFGQKEMASLYSRQSELNEIITFVDDIEKIRSNILSSEELLESGDTEMAEMAHNDLMELKTRLEAKESQIKLLLVPSDPNDSKNAIIEIRAGTGGEEAALFAGDLFRMYTRYANIKKFQVQLISMSETDGGGIKEVIFKIIGKNAFKYLKYESGVHRVQRVPTTESSGRIHTSAASVVVMPEVDDISIQINPNDLRIDVYRSGGNGGQSVNTTDSAVRITHLPTGLVVTSQDTKDQQRNKSTALSVLKARLYQLELEKQQGSISNIRKTSIKTGDRSDKIKTYNFQQDRLTDHRIKKSWFGIEKFLSGEIDEILNTTSIMINNGESDSD